HPTHEPIVLIGGAWVDPVAPAPVGRPVAEVLLHPNGHECVSPTSTKPASGIARGRLQQRVDGHRWDPACLVLLDETILNTKFRITWPPLEGRAVRPVNRHARLEMQLNVGQAAKIAVA